MWNAWLDDSQAGIKTARKNINNLRYADDNTLMVGSEEELKSFLVKVKEMGEKAGLKLNIQEMTIMASGSITSYKIDGKNRNSEDFIFLDFKIIAEVTAAMKLKDTCSLEEKLWPI